MQTRPSQPALLEAVAAFLLSDISSKLEGDKALQFRVLIAANLVGMVANELRTHDARWSAENSRLAALLGHSGSLEELNVQLAKALRAGEFDGAKLPQAIDHVFATAKETLEVTNPRFDVSEEPG